MRTIPFDYPSLLIAKPTTGHVVGSESSDDTQGTAASATTKASSLSGAKQSDNIVIIEREKGGQQAFWLQRKIEKTSHGIVRLGYRVQQQLSDDTGGSLSWTVAPADRIASRWVAIHVMDSTVVDQSPKQTTDLSNPLNELSALQLIARTANDSHTEGDNQQHVQGCDCIANSSDHVYVVLPYHSGGTLLDCCCQNNGNLEERVARYLFRQLLEGMKVLQQAGLCHRNLSMDTVKVDGDCLTIGDLSWCIRVDVTTAGDSEGQNNQTVPTPGGTAPPFVAPEYFTRAASNASKGGLQQQNTTSEWDYFAADLWSCGLILFSMVAGTGATFSAPIHEDKIFKELCVLGKIKEHIRRVNAANKQDERSTTDIPVPSEALLDLLTRMLKADPSARPTLEEVSEHSWVKHGDAVPPSMMGS